MAYPAPRLFAARALSASSAFALTEENARAVAQICARLDGIPLALELAAARIPSLSPEQIGARLDDAFRLLTTGARTALPRQRTLRALVDWSCGLLGAPERALLWRLSAFAGGWTLEAAESVCGFAPLDAAAVLDLLASLVDKSLVLALDAPGGTRYRMLETLRQYGAEKLGAGGEKAGVRRRHRDFFLRRAAEADANLRGAEQPRHLAVLEAEHDNLRRALAFCREDEASGEAGLRLGAALERFWVTRGHLSEGREHLAALLSHPGGQGRTRARADALLGAGALAALQGDYPGARSLYEESLAICRALGDGGGVACCLGGLGVVSREQGDYPGARSLYEESLAVCRAMGDRSGIAASLHNLGNVARHQGDYASAHRLYEESLALRRELGDRNAVAASLNSQGNAAFAQGEYASARSLYEEGLAIFRALGDRSGVAGSLNSLGNVAFAIGDCAAARRLYEEGLAIYRELGERSSIATSFSDLGNVAREQGDYASARSLYTASLALRRELGDKSRVANSLEAFASLTGREGRGERSARLWGAAAALRDALGTPLSPPDREKRENELAAVRASLGEAAFAAAWDAGRAMTWEQATAYALGDNISV
jgi:non-specific serine/threonine protein kinase